MQFLKKADQCSAKLPLHLITVNVFDDVNGPASCTCSLDEFFEANQFSFSMAQTADILNAMVSTGFYVGDEGAGGTWRIEVVIND